MSKKPNSMARLKKARMPFYPEPDQAAALRRLNDTTRIPIQVFLREAVDDLLKKYKKELRA
jgi:hypothetical protein